MVDPALNGPIAYNIKDGSTQYWSEAQFRNHLNPIARLEYMNGDKCVTVPRALYNNFVHTNPGIELRACTIRVTDHFCLSASIRV